MIEKDPNESMVAFGIRAALHDAFEKGRAVGKTDALNTKRYLEKKQRDDDVREQASVFGLPEPPPFLEVVPIESPNPYSVPLSAI